MKLSPNLLALAVVSSLAFPAHADTASSVDADGTRNFDTIQVKGERERAKSANQNTTVIHARQIEDEMAQDMEDLIRYIPGVTIVDMGRFGDNGFNIRGLEGDRVAVTIDGLGFNETVETAVAYEFFRAGRGAIDVDTLKAVEVIKGADSITAGSGALGGAVVFTTKDPRDYLSAGGNDTHVGVKGGYTGATDESVGTVTFANRTGIVESMLVYTRREGHETESYYRDPRFEKGTQREAPDPVDRSSSNLLGKLDLAISDAHRVGFVFEQGRAHSLVDNLSRSDDGAYYQRHGLDSNDRNRYGLRYAWSGHDGLFDNLDFSIDRLKSESRGRTRIQVASGSAGGTPCSVDALCQREENRWTDQVLDRVALDLDKRIETAAATHSLVYGLAWEQRDVDFTAVDYRWDNAGELASVEVDPSQVPTTDVDRWNLYLRDSVGLLDDQLTLTAGLRYDRTRYSPQLDEWFVDNSGTVGRVSFASPTWQLGVEYLLAPQHSVWMQAGRGFRAPSVADMYSPTSTTQGTIAATGETVTLWNSVSNPGLESEKSLNLEAGYRWRSDRLHLGLSVFRDTYTGFIETQSNLVRNPDVEYCANTDCSETVFGDIYSMPANIGRVEVRGVEAEGLWVADDRWSARFAASYNEGTKTDGSPLDSIQPATAVLGVNYRDPGQRWNLTGNVVYSPGKSSGDVDSRTGTGFGTAESAFVDKAGSYVVADLFGSVRLGDSLRLTAGVYNLFDREYYLWQRVRTLNTANTAIHGGVVGDGVRRYSEPGRNYRVTLAYAF